MSTARTLPLVFLTAAALTSVPAAAVRPRAQRQPPSTWREAVACVQTALGGTRAIAAVKSLRMTSTIRPPLGGRGDVQPGQYVVSFAFPDRYKEVEASYLVEPDGTRRPLPTSTWGLNGTQSLGSMDGRPSPAPAWELIVARRNFAHLTLALLVRVPAITGARLTLGKTIAADDGKAVLTIQMNGKDDLNGTLEIDAATCQPRALQWTRPATIGDALSESRSQARPKPPITAVIAAAAGAPPAGTRTVRVTLSDYRAFDGIRFRTTWRRATDGVPDAEQRVTSIEINPTFDAETFAP
jgi:hypothetical protein